MFLKETHASRALLPIGEPCEINLQTQKPQSQTQDITNLDMTVVHIMEGVMDEVMSALHKIVVKSTGVPHIIEVVLLQRWRIFEPYSQYIL